MEGKKLERRETAVINGRLHEAGADGIYRRVPTGMDEARDKADVPEYARSGDRFHQVIADGPRYARFLTGRGVPTLLAEKSGSVVARRAVPGERVRTWSQDGIAEADEVGREGCFFLTKAGPDGRPLVDAHGHENMWQVDEATFRKKYDVPEDGVVDGATVDVKKGQPQDFIQVDRDVAFLVPWGENGANILQFVAKGGYMNVTDPSDVYGISERDFEDTYSVIPVSVDMDTMREHEAGGYIDTTPDAGSDREAALRDAGVYLRQEGEDVPLSELGGFQFVQVGEARAMHVAAFASAMTRYYGVPENGVCPAGQVDLLGRSVATSEMHGWDRAVVPPSGPSDDPDGESVGMSSVFDMDELAKGRYKTLGTGMRLTESQAAESKVRQERYGFSWKEDERGRTYMETARGLALYKHYPVAGVVMPPFGTTIAPTAGWMARAEEHYVEKGMAAEAALMDKVEAGVADYRDFGPGFYWDPGIIDQADPAYRGPEGGMRWAALSDDVVIPMERFEAAVHGMGDGAEPTCAEKAVLASVLARDMKTAVDEGRTVFGGEAHIPVSEARNLSALVAPEGAGAPDHGAAAGKVGRDTSDVAMPSSGVGPAGPDYC